MKIKSKKYLLILAILIPVIAVILIILISGNVITGKAVKDIENSEIINEEPKEITKEYVCPSGTIVSDSSECPVQETTKPKEDKSIIDECTNLCIGNRTDDSSVKLSCHGVCSDYYYYGTKEKFEKLMESYRKK